ncbi:hypothetical protein [Streptomyces cavernae]|uniref:hypothetical protein n=1 Tax=Streptomyces cavernae TaxID=2259034 RepID=UPI000FEB6551|nr:hypothetical protein [Streptomyces cavernae]
MSSERHYGGTTSAFITALVALQRAQGVPLEEAFAKAESLHQERVRHSGSDTFSSSELLAFLRQFEGS